MKILNYRTGFAANSSSTHSPMIAKNIEDVIEVRHGKSFYYDSFIIKEKDSLLEYLGAQINSAMNQMCEDVYSGYREDVRLNKIIIDGLLEKELFKDPEKYSYTNLCVQYDMAGWLMPRKKGCFKTIPNPEFIKDLKKYILNINLVIRGFNTNNLTDCSEKNEYKKEKKSAEIIYEYENKIRRLARDPYEEDWFSYKEDGVWRFFNTNDGTKIRFTFSDNEEIRYATTPELIDLIVTDRCCNNCDFCYRGCKEDSLFADIEDVEKILGMISLTNCSEVAIGGGDLLIYPYLDELLRLIEIFSKFDIVFNTTVNYLSIIKCDENIVDKLSHIFSLIAISVNSYKEIKDFLDKYQDLFFENNCVISFQIIPELFDSTNEINDIKQLLREYIGYNYKITLLGFKDTDSTTNMSAYCRNKISNMHTKDNKSKLANIIFEKIDMFQCDTQFLKNYPNIQKMLTRETYEVNEGTFSCCINAIDQRLYKSSYHLDDSYLLYHKGNCYRSHYFIEDIRDSKDENPIIRGFRKIHYSSKQN